MSDEEQTPIEEWQKKGEEYLAGWKRALADYDNLKKDLVREKGLMRQAVTEEALLLLLPVMENFDAAMKFKPRADNSDVDAWLAGVLQVRTQLEDVLRALGAEPVAREGDAFDPTLHESAGSKKDETKQDHCILEVVQRGWKLGTKVIRPAKVIINHHQL